MIDEPIAPEESPLTTPQEPSPESLGLKKYWADKDGKDFLDALREQRNRFYDFLADTGLADRIERAHQMYYSLQVDGKPGETAVKVAGDEGEIRICEVNEYRNSLGLLKTYITDHEPEWDTIALGDDGEILEAAQTGNQALDALMDDATTGVAESLVQSVEDAFVLDGGYFWHKWDTMRGPAWQVDESGGSLKEGDYVYHTPLIYDVCFDPTIRDFRKKKWLDVRIQENRYDLMAEHPDKAVQIQNVKTDYDSDYARFEFRFGNAESYTNDANDSVWVHYFYHEPTPALPHGRFTKHIGWEIILEDVDGLPDGFIPLYRLIPSQMIGTPFGYTPAFSAQAPQELLNNILSTLATNQDALGNIKIHKKGGDPINRAVLERGITVIETDGDVQALNLLQSSPELYSSVPMYTQMIRQMLAVSNAAAGQSKPSESGSARAFEEQRTQQGASDFVTRFDTFLAEVGTGILLGYKTRLQGQEPRSLIGKDTGGKRQRLKLSAESLQGIERVAIVRGNPEMRTLAGRMKIADALLQSGAIQLTREEYVTTAVTGNLSHLMKAELNELNEIHKENDALLRGERTHVLSPLNNQMLHIREHAAVAKSPEALRDPTIYQGCLTAILEHLEYLMTPEGAQMQAALGYNPGPMLGSVGPPGVAPGTPPGAPQKQPGAQKGPQLSTGGNGPPRLTGGVDKGETAGGGGKEPLAPAA